MEGDEEELRLMCVDEVMLLLNFGEAEQACQLASAAHEQYPTDTVAPESPSRAYQFTDAGADVRQSDGYGRKRHPGRSRA
jgi:hypothetical protein